MPKHEIPEQQTGNGPEGKAGTGVTCASKQVCRSRHQVNIGQMVRRITAVPSCLATA